jgi:hypothetical protein
MYAPYGFHSMSKQYREEVLRDARIRHLEVRLRANRRDDPGRSRTDLAWGRALWAQLRGTNLAGLSARRSEEQT